MEYCIADHPTPKVDVGGVTYTLESRDYKAPQCVVIENHPADSRVKISKDGMVQTLSSRMGTGGGQRAYAYGGRNGKLHCSQIDTA